jgi:hypothetical protein
VKRGQAIGARDGVTWYLATDTEAPCSGCAHRAHCGTTGDACAAFERYVGGSSSWRDEPRVPHALPAHDGDDAQL